MTSSADARYSGADHAFREHDPYARAKYELTLRWLRPRAHAGETLYNIGVGSGYFNHLAGGLGLRVAGCEPDAAAFAAAQASAPRDCELEHCGLEAFAYDRQPANFLVMHDVLEHIEDDRAAVAALRRLAVDGATVVVSVPALMSVFGRHDEQLGHYRRYTRRSLTRVLSPAFTIERMQWFGMCSIPIAWWYSRVRRVDYPMGAQRSPIGAAYGAVCRAESYLPEPIGTSLIARLRPR